ncbi:MAG TPA: hypothetical protein VHZ26_05365 [Caulobacteraceae bacterium]|jgi:hypothetical protein|nr:hypothetical protein [Caulobacteraceae bacterium]
MKAPINSILAALGGVAALAATAATAIAGGCNCTPPPSPPSPPSFNCCAPPTNNVIIPGVSIVVAPSVVVNANVNASAQAGAGAFAATGVLVNGGGGGGGGFTGPGPVGLIQNLNVDNGGGIQRTAYEATRTKIKKVIIEVVCIDDLQVPHPGSQVTPDRDIADSYDGELYRCIAGTHLRATFADYAGTISFDHGWTLDCDKGQALYHAPGGAVACRAQIPARDCNERSLLRRFGAGIKILTMITTERYTAYREEVIQGAASTASSMATDGGVGGVMY